MLYRPLMAFPLRNGLVRFQRNVPHHTKNKLIYSEERHISCNTTLKIYTTTVNHSEEAKMNVFYPDILEAQKDDSILIIDVREQNEIDETGKLPGSIHIPMGDVSNVLQTLSEKDFKEKYGKEKPVKDTKIILSCRSGKRSAMVQSEILHLGYTNAYNYVGGWSDWENRQNV